MEPTNPMSFSMILKKHLQCVTHEFLRELNLSSRHEFERDNALYFDMNYFEKLIHQGDWNTLEHYLGGFTTFQSNDFSKKLFFEIRKQKYLEALEREEIDQARAILNMDLKSIISDQEELLRGLASLQISENFRRFKQHCNWAGVTTSRAVMMLQLPKVVEANPDVNDKLVLPQAADTLLVTLARQSFEAQFGGHQSAGVIPSLLGIHQYLPPPPPPPQFGASPLIHPPPHHHLPPSISRLAHINLQAGPSELAAPAPVFIDGAGPQRASAETATSYGRETGKAPVSSHDPNARTELVIPPALSLGRASAGRMSPPSAPVERASAVATRQHASRPPRAPKNADAPLPLPLESEPAGASLGVAFRTPSPRTAPETSAATPSSSFLTAAEAKSSKDGGARRQGKRIRVEKNEDSSAGARPAAELPGPLVRILEQGSKPTSLDFHPVHHTLLLVGTETAEVTLWDVRDGREKLFSRNFKIWSQTVELTRLKGDLQEDEVMSVKQVRWSQDGSLGGVAFTKGLVQIFKLIGKHRLRPHLQMEAHLSNVNDMAFTDLGDRNVLVTGGDDERVNVFDAASGDLLKSFEGHNASVLCVNPIRRGDQTYFLSTCLNGKLKVWSFDGEEAIFGRVLQDGASVSVQHSTDGSRLFSCVVGKRGKCVVAELEEETGYTTKRKYSGLDKAVQGKLHLHTVHNRYLAVGHDSLIKYWDADRCEMLLSVDAAGGLEKNPVVRFNRDGSLLAATAEGDRVKILVGGVQGVMVINGLDAGAPPPPGFALGMKEFERGASSKGGAGSKSKAPTRTRRS